MTVNTSGDSTPINFACTKSAAMTVELHIHRGKKLVLRNVQWMVTDQGCSDALLSRPVLERMELSDVTSSFVQPIVSAEK